MFDINKHETEGAWNELVDKADVAAGGPVATAGGFGGAVGAVVGALLAGPAGAVIGAAAGAGILVAAAAGGGDG